MGFRLQHVVDLEILNDLERQFNYCFVLSVMRIVTKLLKLEAHGFRCKVALYLSY